MTGTVFRPYMPYSPSNAASTRDYVLPTCKTTSMMQPVFQGGSNVPPFSWEKVSDTLMLLSRAIERGTAQTWLALDSCWTSSRKPLSHDSSTRESARTYPQSQVYICQLRWLVSTHVERLT